MNPESSTSDSGTAIKASPASVGSFVLLVSYFLPWLSFLGGSVAGYDLHKLWKPGEFAFAIPLLAVCAVGAEMTGHKKIGTTVGQIAGGVPLVLLSVALYQFGADLFNGISVGGWLTLISGFFVLCIAPRIGKPDASEPTPGKTGSGAAEHEGEISRR